MKTHTRILVGLLGGVALGGAARVPGAESLQRAIIALEPAGTIFIRLISMVVVPLVVASLFVGVASLGDARRLGRIGGKALVYFVATTLIAATIGLLVALSARLGALLEPSVRGALTGQFLGSGVSAAQAATPVPMFVQSLVAMIPANPFAAAASGDLLPLIVAVVAFGAAASVTDTDGRRSVLSFFQGVNDLAMIIVGWVMTLAPIAVFLLIAATVAKSGVVLLQSLVAYALVVVLALAVHVGLVLIPLVRAGARLGIAAFFRAISDALLLAFSTASSSATLPVSMAAARSRLGISHEIVGVMLPSGATLNKNGAAVYKAVTAVFIMRLYGLPLGPSQMLTIILASAAASFAGPGIPGSSLVTTLIVLNAVGLGSHAAEGIGLVVGIDRPLDMCRSAVNTIGNLVGASLVARSEGEVLTS